MVYIKIHFFLKSIYLFFSKQSKMYGVQFKSGLFFCPSKMIKIIPNYISVKKLVGFHEIFANFIYFSSFLKINGVQHFKFGLFCCPSKLCFRLPILMILLQMTWQNFGKSTRLRLSETQKIGLGHMLWEINQNPLACIIMAFIA